MHLKVAYRNDTKNYRVEIVRSVRGVDGKSTKEVIKRLGSAPLGDRLEGLKMIGSLYDQIGLARVFPNETSSKLCVIYS